MHFGPNSQNSGIPYSAEFPAPPDSRKPPEGGYSSEKTFPPIGRLPSSVSFASAFGESSLIPLLVSFPTAYASLVCGGSPERMRGNIFSPKKHFPPSAPTANGGLQILFVVQWTVPLFRGFSPVVGMGKDRNVSVPRSGPIPKARLIRRNLPARSERPPVRSLHLMCMCFVFGSHDSQLYL